MMRCAGSSLAMGTRWHKLILIGSFVWNGRGRSPANIGAGSYPCYPASFAGQWVDASSHGASARLWR